MGAWVFMCWRGGGLRLWLALPTRCWPKITLSWPLCFGLSMVGGNSVFCSAKGTLGHGGIFIWAGLWDNIFWKVRNGARIRFLSDVWVGTTDFGWWTAFLHMNTSWPDFVSYIVGPMVIGWKSPWGSCLVENLFATFWISQELVVDYLVWAMMEGTKHITRDLPTIL